MMQKLSSLAVAVILFFGMVTLFSVPVVQAITTTITVIGINAPSGQDFVNGFIPLLLPLTFAEIFGAILIYMRRGGDFFVTLFLLGLAIGSSFGTLTGTIPLGMTIIAWVLIGLWWWTGGQGEGASASGDSDLKLPKGWS